LDVNLGPASHAECNETHAETTDCVEDTDDAEDREVGEEPGVPPVAECRKENESQLLFCAALVGESSGAIGLNMLAPVVSTDSGEWLGGERLGGEWLGGERLSGRSFSESRDRPVPGVFAAAIS
jgi:hypothetical protein